VLASNGELVSRIVAREIKRLDSTLEGKRLLDLFVRDKVFLAMLDLVPRNLEALTKEVRESSAEVRQVLQDFDRENLVAIEPGGQPRWKMDRYSLRCDLALFLSLARQYLEGQHRFRFLSSAFASALLAADVPAYLDARWKFRGLERERTGLFRMLALSPSAMNHALFTSTDRYFTPEADARPLGLLERERPRALQFQHLVGDLLIRLAGDMEQPQFQELLTAKGLKAHLFRASARGANTEELEFDLQAESLFAIGRPSQAGRGSGARVESEHCVELGTALMHMREYEQAVVNFDRGIKEIKDPSRLITAWNHRGISLMQLKKFAEATNCFNEALRYNANSGLAWLQKAVCLKELGDMSGAQRCCRRAVEIDPNHAEARELLQIL
jgi:tetratricopeptide (TPR) repeat protein